VNYQKAGAVALLLLLLLSGIVLPLLMWFPSRADTLSYIASIITPRAVLIGGEAILKCHPITHIAIGTFLFLFTAMCNKRVSERG
jgi:hypothetical protein